MADPNSCATCQYRRDSTGSGWCYMFREQPDPLCMQHQDRKRLRPPPQVGMALAVAHALDQPLLDGKTFPCDPPMVDAGGGEDRGGGR